MSNHRDGALRLDVENHSLGILGRGQGASAIAEDVHTPLTLVLQSHHEAELLVGVVLEFCL